MTCKRIKGASAAPIILHAYMLMTSHVQIMMTTEEGEGPFGVSEPYGRGDSGLASSEKKIIFLLVTDTSN